ncbi:hypothetical protein pb186bvf_012952 [Paramecium bursaria]
MGQNLCGEQIEKHDDYPKTSKLMNELVVINRDLYDKILKLEFPQQQKFLDFQQKIHDDIILQTQDPEIYRLTINMNQFQHNNHKYEFYQNIKQLISQKTGSKFQMLVQEYQKFLMQLLNLKITLPTNSKTTNTSLPQNQEFSYVSLSFNDKQEDIPLLRGSKSKNLTIALVQQMNSIFLMCRLIIIYAYLDRLNDYFGNNVDLFPDKEIFVQRLIQHFLLGKGTALKQIYIPLIEAYYQQNDKSIMNMSIVPGSGSMAKYDIQEKLLPPSSQIVEITKDSFLESSVRIFDTKNEDEMQKNKEQIQVILSKSQKNVIQKGIPYSQTFPIMNKLINCTKPWKKFLLIEKMEKLIQRIFLVNRSQQHEFEDLLAAEDSKSEIFLFLIHKFGETAKIKYQQQFNQLRLMNDLDGILHQDVKFVFCPFFLRFLSLLELYIGYDEKEEF